MALAETLGFAPKKENLGDILSVFDTVNDRLHVFREQQNLEAISERNAITALQASLAAREAEIERANRVQERVAAITA